MFENMEMSFDLMPGFNAVFGALKERKKTKKTSPLPKKIEQTKNEKWWNRYPCNMICWTHVQKTTPKNKDHPMNCLFWCAELPIIVKLRLLKRGRPSGTKAELHSEKWGAQTIALSGSAIWIPACRAATYAVGACVWSATSESQAQSILSAREDK